MSPSDLVARLVGLLVTVAGVVLAWAGFLAPLAALDGARGIDLLASGAVANPVVATGIVGIALVVAGLAVLVDRGRSVAVSVGGAVLITAVVIVVLGVDPGVGAAGPIDADAAVGALGALVVGLFALGAVLAGESIDDRSA